MVDLMGTSMGKWWFIGIYSDILGFMMNHWDLMTHMQTMVLVYLPTKLDVFVRANVGVHIPAPWFAYGIALAVRYSHWFCSLKHHGCPCIAGWDPHESAFKRPLASRYRSSHPQLRPRAGGLAVPSEPWPPALGRTTYGRAFDPCQPQPAESCACRSLFWLTTSTERDHAWPAPAFCQRFARDTQKCQLAPRSLVADIFSADNLLNNDTSHVCP